MAERELEQDFEARYDAVCKRVLSHKAILARIMQGCLAEYQDCACAAAYSGFEQ